MYPAMSVAFAGWVKASGGGVAAGGPAADDATVYLTSENHWCTSG